MSNSKLKVIFAAFLTLTFMLVASYYLNKLNVSHLQEKYSFSQYCLPDYRAQHGWDKMISTYRTYCNQEGIFDGNISDSDLYTLAGYEYIQGSDPTSINPETQPLGKYLFGLSTLLFGSPMLVQYLSFASLLLLTYLTSRRLMSRWWSLASPLLLVSDQLVREQLVRPYLDLIQTTLIALYLYIFSTRPRLSMVILALIALSKSFSVALVLAISSLIYLYVSDRQKIIRFIKLSYISLLTYLAGYIMFFVRGHSIVDFVELHVSILRLYHSYVPEYPKGEIFRIVLTGQWREWYGDHGLIPAPGWSLLWPLSLLATFTSLFQKRLRANRTILLHFTWIIVYLTFISLRLVFPRYLMPILPSMYIIMSYVISKFSCNT